MNVSSQEPAPLDSIIFSDHVIREHGSGKLSLIGVFHQINGPKFPFVSPPFYVTVCFGNLEGKIEKLQATVRLEEKGSAHLVCSVSAEVGSKGDLKRTDLIEIPFALPPCQFPNAGIYEAVLLVNSDRIASRDLILQPVTTTRPQQPPT